jgi:hypothetical protein
VPVLPVELPVVALVFGLWWSWSSPLAASSRRRSSLLTSSAASRRSVNCEVHSPRRHQGAAEKRKKIEIEKKQPMHVSIRTLFRLGSVYCLLFRRTYNFVFFLIAFLSSPSRETPKNAPKKIDKGGKIRRTTPQNIFYRVFLVPLTERRLTNATKKIERKRTKKNPPGKIFPPEKYFPGDFFGNVLKIFPVFSKSPC